MFATQINFQLGMSFHLMKIPEELRRVLVGVMV